MKSMPITSKIELILNLSTFLRTKKKMKDIIKLHKAMLDAPRSYIRKKSGLPV